MTSLQNKLKKVRDALLSIEINDKPIDGKLVCHFERPKEKYDHWIVWQEDGEGVSFSGNNRKKEQQGRGTVDCFTKIEYDPLLDLIQEALDNAPDIAWALEFVQYEDDTKLIHYEWSFMVV